MSYSDQKFYTNQHGQFAFADSFGTATASGAGGHTASDVVELPKFIKRTAITGGTLKVTTIPNAASTAVVATILNGTNAIGTAVLTTATSGQSVNFTITTAANGTMAAGTEPTINLVGTSTASGAASGSYDVFLQFNELPS